MFFNFHFMCHYSIHMSRLQFCFFLIIFILNWSWSWHFFSFPDTSNLWPQIKQILFQMPQKMWWSIMFNKHTIENNDVLRLLHFIPGFRRYCSTSLRMGIALHIVKIHFHLVWAIVRLWFGFSLTLIAEKSQIKQNTKNQVQ